MEPARTPHGGATVVAPVPAERVLVRLGFPLAGAAAGWLAKSLAGWAATLDWVPFLGPARLIASIPEPGATVGSLGVGTLAGLALAFLAERDYVIVAVEDDQVTVARAGASRTVPRASIGGVFVDGRRLVLLGRATEELASESGDLDPKRLERAFVARGYPWRAGDPHRDEYRRWIEDADDLSPRAREILRARARALAGGDTRDVAHLREELAALGVVVRDEKKRQYWRRAEPVDRG